MLPTTQYNLKCNRKRYVFIIFQLVPIQVSILIAKICIMFSIHIMNLCQFLSISFCLSTQSNYLFFISDVNSSQPHSEIGSISDIIFKGVLSPVGSVNASYFQYLVNQSQAEMGISVNNNNNVDVKPLKGMQRCFHIFIVY